MDKLQQREDENKLSYFKRITDNRVEYDLDYCEWAELILGEKKYSSDNARKMFYMVKPLLEQLEDAQIQNISDNDILQEIEMKKLELQKEKIKMQDQKRELNKLIRMDARFEHLCGVLKDCIREINYRKPFLYVPQEDYLVDSEQTEAVLMVSDLHFGAAFKNAIAEYNIDIATNRLSELLRKTIQYCKCNNVTTLHLELLGDNISGGIHWSSKVESEEDVITQLMMYEEVISEFIYKLSLQIPYVKVYSVIGNHSRLNMDAKNNQKGENLERLVPHYLKARLQKIKNIEIVEDVNLDDGLICFKVLDTTIMGLHGDLDKPNKVIDDMIKMFKIIPDEFHLGHYHHDFEKTEYDISLVINGSVQGTDSFAYRIRKSGSALQKLLIYNTDGKLCTYKIKLK